MHKKVLLAIATFALGMAAYFVLSSGDSGDSSQAPDGVSEAVNQFVSLPTSQEGETISSNGMVFMPGDETQVRVYDDVSHRLKYQFEAKTWEPVSDTVFHLEKLLIQSYMPRGEITYISADEAEVTLARKSRNRLEPKQGWMKGNVKVTIDRTTSQWREEHPEIADRSAHPDDLVNIFLGEASFDLDQAELVAEGAILVDSSDVRIEDVRGLTLQWDQVDNRIDVLRFAQGGKMTLLRGGKMVDFVMPGGKHKVGSNQPSAGDDLAPGAGFAGSLPKATAMQPVSIDAVTADEAAAAIRMEGGVVAANRPISLDSEPSLSESTATDPNAEELRSPQQLAEALDTMQREAKAGAEGEIATEANPLEEVDPTQTDKRKKRRIHTYRGVFENAVVVEQKNGGSTIGKLESDRLEINFDFGEKQRNIGRPRSEMAAQPTTQPAEIAFADPQQETEQGETQLMLTWNGPLELRPIQARPEEQTGERFDVIASGTPTRVFSEQGTATCAQLVYRHELRQVWLAGSNAHRVELAVDGSRKLIGDQIFFDQRRGLARVDGPGSMMDDRTKKIASVGEKVLSEAAARVASDDADVDDRLKSVAISWSRGVDIELGRRTVQEMDLVSGTAEEKEKEYLRRAWFHGAVSVKQDDEELVADEVAITFGVSPHSQEMADFIQHLNTSGDVRLRRGDDIISADKIDAQMILTPEGRNIPKIVDAIGNVFAGQLKSQIKADKMHVILGLGPGKPKLSDDGKTRVFGKPQLGIESLDASGSIFVSDPDHNLKISRAETLKAIMRNGNQLVRATITSPKESVLARARSGDTAIHGHFIDIDVDAESIDVPGPGKAWMISRKDFSGRKLTKPTSVKITWQDHMAFRLARNYGIFVGSVRTESVSPEEETEPESFSLSCDKLTVRFANVPPVKAKEENHFADRFWLIGNIIDGQAESKLSEPIAVSTERKRPSYIVAEGKAEALTNKYSARLEDGTPTKLRNRMRIGGDQIIVDLSREQMSVPGAGTLLLEDYQFDLDKTKSGLRRSAIKSGPLMSSVGNEGPSQTGVIWKNSMDFFVDRSLVAFDKDVQMVHRSGLQLAKLEELAATMDVDPNELRHLGAGRKANLTCGNLLLEFLVARGGNSSAASPTAAGRVTDLKRLIARQAVHLQDGTKSLMGEYLQYLNDTNEIRLEGTGSLEARIIDQDEESQRLNMWRGPLLIWNRDSNQIEAPKAKIRTSR